MKKILPWVFLISTLIILIILAIFIKNRPWSGYQETTIKPAEKISNIPVFYPNLFNNYLYYLDQENISISRVDLANGKISEIEDLSGINIKEDLITDTQITWNNQNKNLYLIRTETENSNVKWFLGNLESKQLKQIQCNFTGYLEWKDQDNLTYIDDDNYLKVLNINSLKLTSKKKIDTQNVLEIFPSLDGKKTIIAETIEGEVTGSPVMIYDFDQNIIENINQTYIRNPVWSPESEKILFDKYLQNGYGKTEGLLIWSTNNQKQFNFGESLKSVWLNNNAIISAIPQKEESLNDNIYKINIETGEKTLLFKSSNKEHYSVENLMLSLDGKTLYFTSDGYLYKISI